LRRFQSLRFAGSLTIGVLVGLLLLSALGIVIARGRNSSAVDQLDNKLLPAQTKSIALEKAYVDQETGQRGYLLTGDVTFLQPYIDGEARAVKLQRELAVLLGDDAAARAQLSGVVVAYDKWHSETAAPQIAQRKRGPIPATELDLGALQGKQLFDDLRTKLLALTDSTSDMTKAQLSTITFNEHVSDVITVIAVGLAILAAGAALYALRRYLNRPLQRLVDQVQVVAAGDYDSRIDTDGPEEIVTIARAVEAMRDSIVRGTRELVEARQRLTLSEERDRMAADLHDHSIQRLFGLGLQMSATVARHPELRPTLEPMINETDEAIRELRRVVFDLGHRPKSSSLSSAVNDVAVDSLRFLGFSPNVHVALPDGYEPGKERCDELLAVLRESLSNVARHAQASRVVVRVSTQDEQLVLLVLDNGDGVTDVGAAGHGIGNIKARAGRLGGSATVTKGPVGGTRVEWRVPMRSPSASEEAPAPAGA
jgi:signal transduction histidine kinase